MQGVKRDGNDGYFTFPLRLGAALEKGSGNYGNENPLVLHEGSRFVVEEVERHVPEYLNYGVVLGGLPHIIFGFLVFTFFHLATTLMNFHRCCRAPALLSY